MKNLIKSTGTHYFKIIYHHLLSEVFKGLYAPGSTFKMIVAIAGLYHGVINSNTAHFCDGKISLGDRLYHCWKNNGHGSMNVENAIKESCDVFFMKYQNL